VISGLVAIGLALGSVISGGIATHVKPTIRPWSISASPESEAGLMAYTPNIFVRNSSEANELCLPVIEKTHHPFCDKAAHINVSTASESRSDRGLGDVLHGKLAQDALRQHP
jgi:hypothetical protein